MSVGGRRRAGEWWVAKRPFADANPVVSVVLVDASAPVAVAGTVVAEGALLGRHSTAPVSSPVAAVLMS